MLIYKKPSKGALHVSGWVIGVTIGETVIVVTAVLTLAAVVIICVCYTSCIKSQIY